MQKASEISVELLPISPLLAEAVRINPYRVPAGYFDTLAEEIKAEVLVPVTLSNSAFSVPDGYFEGLAGQIMDKVSKESMLTETDDELEAITPVLLSIGKRNVYSVPDGYFEKDLAVSGNPLSEKQPARVVTFQHYKRFIQYVAAAMVAGVLVTGAFMYTDSRAYLKTEKENHFGSSVTDTLNEENESKQTVGEESDTIQDTQEEAALVPQNEMGERKVHDFNKKIQLLSDEELKQYLDENLVPETIIEESDSLETIDTKEI